jgi:hypothetical protein
LPNLILGILGSSGAVASTNSYESIATVTVGSGGSSTVSFSSIPSTYKHLQIRTIGRTNRADVQDVIKFNFNSDTGSNYSYHYLGGDGSSPVVSSGTSTSTPFGGGIIAGNSAVSNVFGTSVIDILDFTSTSKNKTVRSLSGIENNNADGRLYLMSSLWLNTAAITSITLSPLVGSSFLQYSHFALYGIKD